MARGYENCVVATYPDPDCAQLPDMTNATKLHYFDQNAPGFPTLPYPFNFGDATSPDYRGVLNPVADGTTCVRFSDITWPDRSGYRPSFCSSGFVVLDTGLNDSGDNGVVIGVDPYRYGGLVFSGYGDGQVAMESVKYVVPQAFPSVKDIPFSISNSTICVQRCFGKITAWFNGLPIGTVANGLNPPDAPLYLGMTQTKIGSCFPVTVSVASASHLPMDSPV